MPIDKRKVIKQTSMKYVCLVVALGEKNNNIPVKGSPCIDSVRSSGSSGVTEVETVVSGAGLFVSSLVFSRASETCVH